MTRHVERLRRLSMSDPRSVAEVLASGDDPTLDGALPPSGLEPRTLALVRIAALVAVDGPTAAFDAAVAVALAAGASPDDIVDTMLAIGPTIGSAHLVSVSPKIAL